MSSESKEVEFVDGLIVKAPRDGAPDFVKASISIKREDLIAWLAARSDDWVNVQVKESRGGKWYAAVDTWKPKEPKDDAPPRKTTSRADPAPFEDDEIPF